MTDLKTLTDNELATLLDDARAEYQRRQTLQTALAEVPALQTAYLDSTGRGMGEPYKPPTSYLDAYPKGWTVTHDGTEWVALRDGAIGVPGMSSDWREVLEEGQIPEWTKPNSYLDAWEPGAVVTHEGRTWRNDYTAGNSWEPGTPHSQWTDITDEH